MHQKRYFRAIHQIQRLDRRHPDAFVRVFNELFEVIEGQQFVNLFHEQGLSRGIKLRQAFSNRKGRLTARQLTDEVNCRGLYEPIARRE